MGLVHRGVLLGSLLAVASAFAAQKECVVDPFSPLGNGLLHLYGQVQLQCCNRYIPRREYMACVRKAMKRLPFYVLAPECMKAVRACARTSVCGRGDAVACCLPTNDGTTTCRLFDDAASCVAHGGAPSGGWTCCNACGGSKVLPCVQNPDEGGSGCGPCTRGGMCKFCYEPEERFGCMDWTEACGRPAPPRHSEYGEPGYYCD